VTGEVVSPTSEDDLRDLVAEAAGAGRKLAIRGGGSKAGVGRPEWEATVLDLRGFTGVVDYDPPELVLTVRPGTPLSEVQALVAGRNQMLAFEPFDHGPLFGQAPGAATIGGVVAAGVSGSQRVSAGAARDHLLGLRAVSGRGELFVAGAKVVKNVTGYDLPKLMAGSWGRLGAMTELTLKVMPAPRVSETRVLLGLDVARAVAAMAAAMGSPAEVAAAAHLPGDGGVTAFRLQGFAASVAARAQTLARVLAPFGRLQAPGADSAAIWTALRTLSPLPIGLPLWRINVPPSGAVGVIAALEPLGARWLLDWAGGLVWAAGTVDPAAVRTAATAARGHAVLVRWPGEEPAPVRALHPLAPGVAALEERVRRAFDPAGVFETGRF
jgi:glycolate oxidase FAD binding subunit